MIACKHCRQALFALGVLLPLLATGALGLAATAQAQSQQLAPTEAARLELRIQQLESQVRSLTGRVEELTYKLNQLQAAPSAQGQAQSSTASTATQNSGGYQGQAQGTAGAGQPQVLGSVNQSSVDAVRSQAPDPDEYQQQDQGETQSQSQTASAIDLPSGTPKEKYDYAFDLLRQANYQAAEQAFEAFLQQHPDDSLAGNAKYWLGETYYVRGDNQNAAIVFAEGFQEYPDSSKAPDNLLKLGMALANLGSTQDACGTFSELQRRYPDAASTILRRAERERSRLGCG